MVDESERGQEEEEGGRRRGRGMGGEGERVEGKSAQFFGLFIFASKPQQLFQWVLVLVLVCGVWCVVCGLYG